MKYLQLLAVMLVLGSEAQASPIAGKWEPVAEVALGSALATRCQFLYLKSFAQCQWLSHSLIQAMDQKSDFQKEGIVFFYQDFLKYARSPAIHQYLNELEKAGQAKVDQGELFPFYDFTLDWVKKYRPHLKNPDFEAAKMMAVLFQDNVAVEHLNYFKESEPKAIKAEVLETMMRIHTNLLPSQMYQPKSLELYFPKDVRPFVKDFNPGIYYFYMTWLYSQKIKQAAGGSRFLTGGLHRDLPLMLSLIYKYRYYYDGSYAKAILMPFKATSKLVGKNLVSISKLPDGTIDNGWTWRYHDLYAAYISTHVWKREKPRSQTLTYAQFAAGIGTAPGGTLSLIHFGM